MKKVKKVKIILMINKCILFKIFCIFAYRYLVERLSNYTKFYNPIGSELYFQLIGFFLFNIP